MVLSQVRNYLSEFRNTIATEWKLFQKFGFTTPDPSLTTPDADLRRLLITFRDPTLEQSQTDEYRAHYNDTYYGFIESDHVKQEPFEFYGPRETPVPDSRLPAPGLQVLNARYHKERVVRSDADVPESGFDLHPLLRYLIVSKYPTYLYWINKYCRPLGTTDATFADFNKEQKEYPPIPTDLVNRIVNLTIHLLNAKRFLPLHYVDTFFARMPIHTGASYFYRHSYELRTHAAFSHPPEYRAKQTSKGYYLNAFTEWARSSLHRIKLDGYPFPTANLSPSEIADKARTFFMEHATMLFTRNHISDRDGTLKQRPVYAMDTFFLHIECMLSFPLHVLARSTSSCIMYSLETIRGGCAFMDARARSFCSYMCIDWSAFDQRMPWIIVDTFFTVFLPALLVINCGYQPTYEYPTYPGLTAESLFSRLFNLLCFLRLWYFNCVFVTADGFPYIRKFAGIASGMLNTQYLDSYCNLFLIIHALIHYGCVDQEILSFCFFIMGDDNVVLSLWNYERLLDFMTFFEEHALSRFGMVLSKQKSIITTLRSRIEMLGYRCSNAKPTRPLGKLIAQLCYPEHGPIDKFMSSRAVGMAWASAGQDAEFHQFCQDVYDMFKPFAQSPDTFESARIAKYLPGMFKMLDDISEFTNPEKFPTLDEVRHRYQKWQGELPSDKKWSPAHFATPPGVTPPDSITMAEFMLERSLKFPDILRLF